MPIDEINCGFKNINLKNIPIKQFYFLCKLIIYFNFHKAFFEINLEIDLIFVFVVILFVQVSIHFIYFISIISYIKIQTFKNNIVRNLV